MGEVVTTIPTIGFNVETVTYKNLKFQVWDLGGQTSIRPYWDCGDEINVLTGVPPRFIFSPNFMLIHHQPISGVTILIQMLLFMSSTL